MYRILEPTPRESNQNRYNLKVPMRSSIGFLIWCGWGDSNSHALSGTSTSSLRVYQFHHNRDFLSIVPIISGSL